MVIGLVSLGLYAVWGPTFAYDRILDDSFWYRKGFGWVRKLGFVQLAGFFARTKYYAIWSLSEVGS
jgi:lysophospholipid acyltransferase